MIHETFLTTLLLGALMAAFPLFLAGFGEMLSEQAGVLNLGLEGMMLAGAFTSFYLVYETHSYTLGFLGGASAGLMIALIVVFFCIWRAVDQVVLGLSLTFVVQGATSLLHHVHFARTYPRLEPLESFSLPLLSQIPFVGGVFQMTPFTLLCVCALSFLIYFYGRSTLKLQLMAAGSNPKALDVFGANVFTLRTGIVLFTGAMAGLGGAYMVILGAGIFVPNMTNGAGFIAIVLAMVANGRVFWLFLGALLFGVSLSASTILQLLGSTVSTDITHMLPFILIMIVLVLFRRHVAFPKALGQPYVRTKR